MFTIIYDDKYRDQSLSKYTGIISNDDTKKIIKNHKDWFNISNEEVIETKEIIKKIFNLNINTNLLGSTYKDALVMNIESKNSIKNIHYCIKIIDDKIEAYILKATMYILLDDDENLFDFIEMVMIDGINTQNIYA